MSALAEVEDIPGSEAFSTDQRLAAVAAIERASAAVRAYTRQSFTSGQHVTRMRARGNWLVLPQRPVVSVDLVKVIVNGAPTTTTGWVWDGLDRVWIGNLGMVVNLAEEVLNTVANGVTVAEVTYTAGYPVAPDDVVAVTAGLASRALAVPAGGAFTQQQVGPFSYTVAPWAQGGPLTLSDSDKAILSQYRRAAQTVELRS